MVQSNKFYSEMFDYLRQPELPTEAHGNFVFGRYDTRLVKKMGETMTRDLVSYYLITGGLGKDSGYLHELGIPEANYLASVAASQDYRIPPEMIHRETEARNGGENARFGLKVIHEKQLPADELTVIAHATSLRRLSATLDIEADNLGKPAKIYRIPTEYPFDPSNPMDRNEASAEMLRLADWPAKGWAATQLDLPENLVDFARDTSQQK